MNHNLAVPWADKSSPPLRPELAFFSAQAEDMMFSAGDTVELRVRAGVRSVGLTWTLARNAFTTPFRTGVADALPAGQFRIRLATAVLHPGFYDLRVRLNTGAQLIDGLCTFGWRAGDVVTVDTRPADFAQFWNAAKASLARIALDAQEGPLQRYDAAAIAADNLQRACLPADYDPTGHVVEEVEAGKVSLAGPDGGRVHGWLAKPLGKGPFPAMLVLPGAGFAARPRPLEHARHGYVAMDIQVHGQEVDLPQYEKIPGHYENQDYSAPEKYYYYRVHLRCLQALRYLLARPDVDPARVVVVGGSQGGRLGVIVAGLDPRVRAVVSCIANSANRPWLAWAEACNKVADTGMSLAGPPLPPDSALERILAYYDIMNFAPDVRAAVLMNCGLIDPVSPPASVFAIYEKLGCTQREMVALDGMAHDWSAEFDRRAWRWLANVFAPAGGR